MTETTENNLNNIESELKLLTTAESMFDTASNESAQDLFNKILVMCEHCNITLPNIENMETPDILKEIAEKANEKLNELHS
ncbi:MAG: hypothetical protein WCF92_00175 [bacterium]